MANYHRITIESTKMTQNVASDIFQYLAQHNRITDFDFSEGFLTVWIRGYSKLGSLLTSQGFDQNDCALVIDEFTLASDADDTFHGWSIWEFEEEEASQNSEE